MFVADGDGGGLHRLATGWGGTWSPDGTKIAYASSVNGYALGVVGLDGQAPVQVAGGTPPVTWEWSPDSRLVAYTLQHDPTVYLLDVSSGTTSRLARAADPVGWAVWSLDGSRLAIEAGSAVDLVDATSGQLTVLAQNGSQPIWSPDGVRIAFESSRSDSDGVRLETIGADGSDRRVLSPNDTCQSVDLSYNWGVDSKTLYFEKPRSAGSGCDIWRADLTDGRERPVTNAFPSGADFEDPYWTPATIPRLPAPEQRHLVSLQPAQTLQTKEPIYDLAADGDHAAIVTGSWDGPVSMWNRDGPLERLANSSVDFNRLQLVVAGNRAAWTDDSGGAPPTYYLTVGAGGGKIVGIDSVYLLNEDLGNLAGDGPLLVYNTWGAKYTKLWRIVGSHKQLLAHGSDSAGVVDVNAGRIAILHPDGELVLLNKDGKPLSRLRVSSLRASKQVAEVLLRGAHVLTRIGSTLEVRDLNSGTLLRHWRLADADGPLTLDGAQGNLAVYTEGVAIHLLRLSDGRDVVLKVPDEEGPAYAALEPQGLYFSYNRAGSPEPGRIAFVPMNVLRRRLLIS